MRRRRGRFAIPMPRLFLLRHAKSSWEDRELADHERPLAPRGRRATKLMAKHVRRKGIRPQLVLCSSARRARETLDGVGLEAGEVRIEDELYGASAPELLRRLREVPDTVESVLLVGHNPAMQELAITVAGGGALLGEVERKFPTGALATLELAGDWGAIGPGRAELVAFVRPRELG